jgi:hypothetical protein
MSELLHRSWDATLRDAATAVESCTDNGNQPRRTQMTETPNFTPDIEAIAQRIKETSDRVLALSKENGLTWLEAYEKMLNGVLKLEEDTAKELSSDWVETLVSTQADFIRETSQAYLGAFKNRLK